MVVQCVLQGIPIVRLSTEQDGRTVCTTGHSNCPSLHRTRWSYSVCYRTFQLSVSPQNKMVVQRVLRDIPIVRFPIEQDGRTVCATGHSNCPSLHRIRWSYSVYYMIFKLSLSLQNTMVVQRVLRDIPIVRLSIEQDGRTACTTGHSNCPFPHRTRWSYSVYYGTFPLSVSPYNKMVVQHVGETGASCYNFSLKLHFSQKYASSRIFLDVIV